MLVFGRHQFAAHFRWFLATVLLTTGVIVWYFTVAGVTGTLPTGGTRIGLILGVIGAAIIGFEMLIWPRKRFYAVRTLPLFRTKYWLKAHIWLGLFCVPVAILHSGFRSGGSLSTSLMIVFAIVIASGIWGLFLQAYIPRRMLERVPDEVPVHETERVIELHALEFERRLAIDQGKLGGAEVPGVERIAEYYESTIHPYLIGEIRPEVLARTASTHDHFQTLRARTPAPSHPRLDDLQALCHLRRQFDMQRRLHWWLHSWVWVHLPLSVALVGLLIAHIYVALRYI